MSNSIFIGIPQYDCGKDIFYLQDYHPYRLQGIKNPKFESSRSRYILDLKDKKQSAINYFFRQLNGLLNQGIIIVTVPSSNPENTDAGVVKLASTLCKYGRIDGTSYLYRYKKVEKKSNGGNRDMVTDLNSIAVHNLSVIRDKTVLLMDDVTTTGNSLQACKILLSRHGAKVVKFAVGKTVR